PTVPQNTVPQPHKHSPTAPQPHNTAPQPHKHSPTAPQHSPTAPQTQSHSPTTQPHTHSPTAPQHSPTSQPGQLFSGQSPLTARRSRGRGKFPAIVSDCLHTVLLILHDPPYIIRDSSFISRLTLRAPGT
ncbi:hypothetical protein BaRGS_00038241, partial [Batillaria attramentaria]